MILSLSQNWYRERKELSEPIESAEPEDSIGQIEYDSKSDSDDTYNPFKDVDTTKDPWSDPWTKVESSFIDSIAYFASAWILEVKLKDGKKYTFMHVPPDVYEEFKNSDSKGKYFQYIRKEFKRKN